MFTLLNAYERILNLQYHIPTDIKTQIMTFYGHSMFSAQSIIATTDIDTSYMPSNVITTKTFNASCVPTNVASDQLNIGETIEISFDETNPNLYNIPTILRSVKYQEYKQNRSVGTVVCGICCLIIYIVIIVVYQHWTAFYYLMYSIYLCLVVGCVHWCESRDNAAEQRAKDYGTFRNEIRESENIHERIRDEKKFDYRNMEMNNQNKNHSSLVLRVR